MRSDASFNSPVDAITPLRVAAAPASSFVAVQSG
jgi:hypothetical protein